MGLKGAAAEREALRSKHRKPANERPEGASEPGEERSEQRERSAAGAFYVFRVVSQATTVDSIYKGDRSAAGDFWVYRVVSQTTTSDLIYKRKQSAVEAFQVSSTPWKATVKPMIFVQKPNQKPS